MPAVNTFSVADRHVSEPDVTLQLKKESCWLQVLSHLSPQYGGIAASVPRLARATEAASQHACPIAGFCDSGELEHLPEDRRAEMQIFPPDRMRWIMDTGLRRTLKNTIRASTGVHIHGVWDTHCMMAAGIAPRLQSFPHDLSPRNAGRVGVTLQASQEGPLRGSI